MKLFYTPFDHVHAVEAVINYCGLHASVDLIPISPFADDASELTSRNPLGTVPTLVADDGTVLFGGPVARRLWQGRYLPRRSRQIGSELLARLRCLGGNLLVSVRPILEHLDSLRLRDVFRARRRMRSSKGGKESRAGDGRPHTTRSSGVRQHAYAGLAARRSPGTGRTCHCPRRKRPRKPNTNGNYVE